MSILHRLPSLAIAATLCLFGLDHGAHAEESGAYDGPKEKLHIYLLIGQSNMAGRAPISATESGPLDDVYLLNGKDQWEVAQNPLNRYSTIRKGLKMQMLNPGYGFARSLLKKQGGNSLGLVVNAKGGSKIEQWKKGTRFYREALRRAQAAQQSGVIKGILWHQGESNEGNPDGYLDQLVALVQNLRKDLGVAELPFIAGQVNRVPRINAQIAQLPAELPHTGYVPSDGLKTMDRWHFDAASMNELGERYAEAMLKAQAGLKGR